MTRVGYIDVPNRGKSAISKDGICFTRPGCRIRDFSKAPEIVAPWNANADAIADLQATVIELTQKVWELESRLNALP